MNYWTMVRDTVGGQHVGVFVKVTTRVAPARAEAAPAPIPPTGLGSQAAPAAQPSPRLTRVAGMSGFVAIT
jgi:hypothetical protein